MDESDRPVLRTGVRKRAPVRVMLVRVPEALEPPELVLTAVQILRVRHPIPACERMRVTRPEVVVVGHGVRDVDCVRLEEAAGAIAAEVFLLGAGLSPSFASWLRGAIRRALDRRGGLEPSSA